jgi:hypothetical protein
MRWFILQNNSSLDLGISSILIAMSTSKLLNRFPWAKSPLIINAPMAGAATPRLATEVSKTGGLGMTKIPNQYSHEA